MTTLTNTNLTNQTKSSSSQGVTISNRPTSSYIERIRPSKSIPPNHKPINEQPWTLDKMLNRWTFIASVPWASASTAGTILASYELPQAIQVTQMPNAPFSAFRYWRGDFDIMIQVAGTPFHMGKIMASFVPLVYNGTYTNVSSYGGITSIMVNPTVHLFANANTSANLYIPYNNPQKYLNLNVSDSNFVDRLGTLVIYVQNPLQFATSATDTVTISIFMRARNNEFKVPLNTTGPLYNEYVTVQPQSDEVVTDHEELDLSSPAPPPKRKTGGFFDFFKSLVRPTKFIADGIKLVSTFGSFLDKPTNAEPPAPIVTRVMGPLNMARGLDNIDKLTLDTAHVPVCEEYTFGTSVDEMSLSYLKKIPTYIGSFNITTSNAIGDVVATMPMSPIPVNITPSTYNTVPLISYIAMQQNYWRGGLTFTFEVVATSLQTCKIFAGLNYGKFVSTPLTGAQLGVTSQYGEAFEINQGTNSLVVTVPYVSVTDWTHVPSGDTLSLTNCLGLIQIVVLNKLVCPNNTPTSITINVYINGADDFELSVPSYAGNFLPVIAQSADQVVAPLNLNETILDPHKNPDHFARPPTENDRNVSCTIPRPIDHYKFLLNKYQFCGTTLDWFTDNAYNYSIVPIKDLFLTLNLSQSNSTIINPVTATAAMPTTATPINGMLSQVAAMYRGFFGGLRFKLFDKVPNSHDSVGVTYEVFYLPPFGKDATSSPGNTWSNYFVDFVSQSQYAMGESVVYTTNYAPFTTSGNRTCASVMAGVTNRCLEFEVPFHNRFQYAYLDHYQTVTTAPGTSYGSSIPYPAADLGALLLITRNDTTDLTTYLVASLADESRFGVLYNVPKMTVPTYYNGTAKVASPLNNYTGAAVSSLTFLS